MNSATRNLVFLLLYYVAASWKGPGTCHSLHPGIKTYQIKTIDIKPISQDTQ